MVNDSLFPGEPKGTELGEKTAQKKRGVCWACLWGVAGFSPQVGAEPGLDQGGLCSLRLQGWVV